MSKENLETKSKGIQKNEVKFSTKKLRKMSCNKCEHEQKKRERETEAINKIANIVPTIDNWKTKTNTYSC